MPNDHELLTYSSLFLHIASQDDIEQERQQMEAKHDCKLAIFVVDYPTRSGVICTRITWEKV